MKKLLTTLVLVLLCLLAVSVTAFATDSAKVTVNGADIKLDQPPVIREGRVFIPLRAVGEALLCKVDWESETQTAILNSGYAEIRVTIGEYSLDRIYVSDSGVKHTFTLDAPAFIENGRTMVPLRAVSEALFLDVDWNEEERTAIINKIYDNIGIETNGYIRVDIADKMGFMDINGNIVIPIEYENDISFGYVQGEGRYAIVKKNGKYGAVDMENKSLVTFSYTLENIDSLRIKAENTLKRQGK